VHLNAIRRGLQAPSQLKQGVPDLLPIAEVMQRIGGDAGMYIIGAVPNLFGRMPP